MPTTQTPDYINKPYDKMSIDELHGSVAFWTEAVNNASGWSSAYFAAKELKAAIAWLARRGITMKNPYPIMRG